MRRFPIYLFFLPLLLSCTDEQFVAELVAQSGPIKYFFVANIDTTQVESRVAFDPLDHGNNSIGSTAHFHDLSLHWEAGDKVTLSDGDNSYVFTAEALDVDGDPSTPSKIVFTYRGGAEIQNASSFTGTAIYTPAIDEDVVGHQSENCNADHLKNFGPVLKANLTNVDLTYVTGKSWLETDSYTPIRFRPDSEESEYAYFKIEVNGFKYPIWGKGTLWVYILEEGCADYNDYHEPWAKITFGSAPTNMVAISGRKNPNKDSEKYLWPNLKEQDTRFKLGEVITEHYEMEGIYPKLDSNGKKVVRDSTYLSISFPHPTQENPFIAVPEYFEITPNKDVDADDYEYKKTDHPEKFEETSQHYKLFDITGNFYVPVKKKSIKGETAGNLYIATVLQCGWSGDLYVWEKKVPTDIDIEGGKFYVLDYSKHKPEYAIKFAENTYFRSTYLEQNFDNTDAPRYTLFGELAEKGGVADNPNRIVGPGKMSKADVQKMMKNSGAFMHNITPMCAIYPGTKMVKWEMYNDTTFKKIGSGLGYMKVFKTDATSVSYPIDSLVKGDVKLYSMDGGIWDRIINKSNVCTPQSYLTGTKDYMCKIAKGIINPNSTNFTGKGFFNSLEYVLLNEFDPVMRSTKTCNLWRAPYAADIFALCEYSESVFFRKGQKFVFESSKTGHRICLPYIDPYSTKAGRGINTDGTGGASTGTWAIANETDVHFIAGRSVRTFGSSNPAYMQALDISYSKNLEVGRIGSFNLTTKFNMAFPVLPVFRWQLPSSSTEGVIEW